MKLASMTEDNDCEVGKGEWRHWRRERAVTEMVDLWHLVVEA